MKICPKCQTTYDEEIIRFCTRDGSPLVEENPSFTAMPSQSSIDDIGEETLITRNRPVIPPSVPPIKEEASPAPRVIIPIGEEKKQQSGRPLDNPQNQYRQPRKSNTALVVLLTIFGTIALLGGGIGAWWLLSGQNPPVANTNTNINVAVNSANVPVNYNSNVSDFLNTNVNLNVNVNSNVNSNANIKSPTPTPSKTPTPKPSPTGNENVDININGNTIINITPANVNSSNNRPATPSPTVTPKPSPASTTPANVNVGVMNSRAKELRKPSYPPLAKQMGISGKVEVQVSIDENGNVVGAKAISGPALLRVSAESAARQSSFHPVRLGDKSVRASGTVVYNFIN